MHLGVSDGFANKGWLRVASADDDAIGATLVRPPLAANPHVVPIIAAAVPTDLRRLQIGLDMLRDVDAWAMQHGADTVQAVCRAGLPSNLFWAAAGFTAAAVRFTTAARRKPLIIWLRRRDGLQLHAMQRPRKPRGPGGRWVPEADPTAVERIETDTAVIRDVLADFGHADAFTAVAERPILWVPYGGHRTTDEIDRTAVTMQQGA